MSWSIRQEVEEALRKIPEEIREQTNLSIVEGKVHLNIYVANDESTWGISFEYGKFLSQDYILQELKDLISHTGIKLA